MKLDLAFTKIDKYLQSKKSQPIIVDIQNGIDFEKLKERFPSSFYSYKNAGSYCKKDSYCRLDNLKNDLSNSEDDLFITGLSTFLRLQGKEELRSQLRVLLDLSTESHVVIITYQCSKYLDFHDKYYDAQPTAEEFVYQVSMPDIRKAKNYIFDVYASENMIASGLQFNVKSEVTVEKDLF